ncbi:MAG: M48 family metalloprotease [Burkholderiaceae bacterium]
MSELRRKAACLVTTTLLALVPLAARGQPDGIRTKEITQLSPRASVVLDRNCPLLVQPFTLSDNAASLALFSAKEAISDVGKRLLGNMGNVLARGLPSMTPQGNQLSASTKLAAKQLNWLPMTAEVAYGERLHQDEAAILERESRLGHKHYPTADRMLESVLAAVGQPHEYQFKLFILKNSSRNAIARPGGFLYLDQGLVDDPAHHPKAYFALAHEVAHVLQRHETKELQSNVIDSISSKDDLARVITGSRGDPNLILAHVKIEKNRFTRHHVDQELQADSCAARLLGRALPDQKALAAAIDAFLVDLPPAESFTALQPSQSDDAKLAQTVHDVVDTPIKRHPNNQERVQNLRSIHAEITAGAPKGP